MDPRLEKALKMNQYSTQYLLSCQRVMTGRKEEIKHALKVFHEEETELDLQLAKLRLDVLVILFVLLAAVIKFEQIFQY